MSGYPPHNRGTPLVAVQEVESHVSPPAWKFRCKIAANIVKIATLRPYNKFGLVSIINHNPSHNPMNEPLTQPLRSKQVNEGC